MPFKSSDLNEKFKEIKNKIIIDFEKEEITGSNEDTKGKLLEQLNKLQNNSINKNKKYSVEVNNAQLEKMRLCIKNFITKGEIDTITKLNAKLEEVKNDFLLKVNDNDEKITS